MEEVPIINRLIANQGKYCRIRFVHRLLSVSFQCTSTVIDYHFSLSSFFYGSAVMKSVHCAESEEFKWEILAHKTSSSSNSGNPDRFNVFVKRLWSISISTCSTNDMENKWIKITDGIIDIHKCHFSLFAISCNFQENCSSREHIERIPSSP